ncbi:hypothetical protein V1523DRAFT_422348 [Lipomyces doorenjongii]
MSLRRNKHHKIQQLQLESLAEIQVEEFSAIQTESSTSLASLQEPLRRPEFLLTNWKHQKNRI